jgi:CDP-diglyceride synthetase
VVTTDVMTSGTVHEDPHEFDEAHVSPRTEQVRIVGAARAAGGVEQTSSEADTEARAGTGADRGGDADADEGWVPEGSAVSAEPRLPHWTEAPTGEIPAVLARGEGPEAGDPWASLPEPTWREEQRDWEREEPLAPSLLAGHGDESPLLSEADEEERQPWSFDLGTAAVGPSPDETDVDELDDVASGELFGASVRARTGHEETGEADETDETELEDVDVIAGERTSVLQVPGPGGSGEYVVEVEEEAIVLGEVDGEGPAAGFEGARDGRDLATAGLRGPGRVRTASTWLHVRSRRGEHADAAAVAADAAAAAADASSSAAGPAAGALGSAPRLSRATVHRAPAGHRASGVPRRGEDVLSQRTGRNIPAAVVSGIVIGGLALLAFHFGTVPSMVIVTAALTAAAIEAYAAFRKTYRPATLLGIVAVAGVIVGSYDEPLFALPVVVVLLFAATVLWHLVGVDRRAEPVRSTAATLLVFSWVGVFGSFAALLLAPSSFPHRTGIAYLLGALIAAVAYDVGALVVGAWVGRHPLSAVSPGKTWEGVLGGAVAAIVFAVAIVHLVHPWTLGEAAALGVVVAVVSPIGDLCESLVKRQLGLKDMGRVLPGHGGLLDRVDGLLFVLPATYYLVRAFGHG